MKLIASDFSRRIDLPGVGPAPRPVDIDQSTTGFDELVSLRIYSFAPGSPINGEAEGDEVAIVVLNGSCEIAVTGAISETFMLRADGGPRGIYLPPEHHYRLTPLTSVDVAYGRARSRIERAPRSFAGASLTDDGYFEKLQFTLAAVPAGKTITVTTPSGAELERLLFVQSNKPVGIAGASLHSWDCMTLDKGEAAELTPLAEALVLVVAAR